MAQWKLITISIVVRCVKTWNFIEGIPNWLARTMLALTGWEAQASAMYQGGSSTRNIHRAKSSTRASTIHPIILCLIGIGGFQPMILVFAADRCVAPAATRVVSVQGNVTWSLVGSDALEQAKLNDLLCVGDTVRVGAKSRAVLRLPNETTIPLDQNTVFQLKQPISDKEPTLIELIQGAIHVITRTPKPFKVNTPYMNAAVEGTEFYVGVDSQEARVAVIEGKVNVSNEQGTLLLTENEAATARLGQAPQKTLTIKPRDAVQWALYYPPVIDPRSLAQGGAPLLAESYALFNRGDTPEAIARLDQISESERDATFYAYRASLLLHVGRADEAEPDIERALKDNPNNADALSLKAIIAIVRNDKAKALELATQATNIDDKSAAARIALSYAQQANFKIEEALQASRQATEKDSNNALAWARVAELELSIPNYDKSKQAAEKAVKLNPYLARTQSILGFANLTRIDIKAAKESFNRAIELDQADPLPRLGLGLATIREGKLEDGREQIEIAASLDPENSLIRSYLGKAYYEEKRDDEAGTQFDLAKERDPKDPTPWLYDAIRKQTKNLSVGALQDLEESIDRNDNRAPYRSRLMLDQDNAARSASLARIYADLGFEQLALSEGYESLATNPSNYFAHRFLSDAYERLPRHEIARVSELLQAQLRQPLSVNNTIQPRLSVTELNVVSTTIAPTAALADYTSAFDHGRWRLLASGLVGNQDTIGDEAIFSAATGSFAYSVGQFHYKTDGFRENNDVQHDVYGLQAQYAASSTLSLQTEFRHRESDQGDLAANFDAESFSNFSRRDINEDLGRFGLFFAPSASSDLILSVIRVRREGAVKVGEKGIIEIEDRAKQKGTQAEGQYAFHGARANMIIGAGGFRIHTSENAFGINLTVDPPDTLATSGETKQNQNHGYIYSTFLSSARLAWTLGISQERTTDDGIDLRVKRTNPKVGLQWTVTPNFKLRLAALRTLKRPLAVDQTIEPTQVAGFNQFFDDLNATKSTLYGLGLDGRIKSNLYAGFQITRRDLSSPGIAVDESGSTVVFQDMRERVLRSYLYWTPSSRWAFSVEAFAEFFDRSDLGFPTGDPSYMKTLSVPLTLRYFATNGIWGKFGVDWVHQTVDRFPVAEDGPPPPPSGQEDFALINAAVGYRFPQRGGMISIEAKNLSNEKFRFQDDNFRRSQIVNPRYVPGRTMFVRFNLAF